MKTRYLGYTHECLSPNEQTTLDALTSHITAGADALDEKGHHNTATSLRMCADRFVGYIIEHREKTEAQLKAQLKEALKTGGGE